MRTTRLKSVVFLIVMLMLTGCANQGHSQYSNSQDLYSPAELDQMLAPIALYPDALLSQILMASTYPLEVVEAYRWTQNNPGIDGEAAVDAVEHEDWDPSVKSLVAFPQVLARMDQDLDWTQRLGDAYLMQEGDVIDSIQRLREHAYDAGQLNNVQHVRAYRERDVIFIEPVSTSIVYVPYYNPVTLYHNWWWPDYPPHYWGPPPGFHTGISFYWGSGIHIAPTFFFSTFHWHDRHIAIVDRHHYISHYRSPNVYDRYRGSYRWRHDPVHRRGVHYPRHISREDFYRSPGGPSRHDGYPSRENYRGQYQDNDNRHDRSPGFRGPESGNGNTRDGRNNDNRHEPGPGFRGPESDRGNSGGNRDSRDSRDNRDSRDSGRMRPEHRDFSAPGGRYSSGNTEPGAANPGRQEDSRQSRGVQESMPQRREFNRAEPSDRSHGPASAPGGWQRENDGREPSLRDERRSSTPAPQDFRRQQESPRQDFIRHEPATGPARNYSGQRHNGWGSRPDPVQRNPGSSGTQIERRVEQPVRQREMPTASFERPAPYTGFERRESPRFESRSESPRIERQHSSPGFERPSGGERRHGPAGESRSREGFARQ